MLKEIFGSLKKGGPKFIKYFICCLLAMMIARLATTSIPDPSRDTGYMLMFALLLTCGANLWQYGRQYSYAAFLFLGQYFLAACGKRGLGMMVFEREITHTLGMAVVLFITVALIRKLAEICKNKFMAGILRILSYVAYGIFILPPLVYIGYFLVNKSVFSPDIMLTFFQTNPAEIWAYIKEQNMVIWSLGWLCIILLIGGQLILIKYWKSQYKNIKMLLLTLILLLYEAIIQVPKLNLCFIINIAEVTDEVLQSFDDFNKTRQQRMQKLDALLKSNLSSPQKGVYVLIIGESETRDHMQVYGYHRPTTPWLSSLSAEPNTIIFKNAYSNHTHTVPTLTYALSAKNQYNDIEPDDAYSIVEAAKAAGFKVYWLSNQTKFSAIDTPITVTASMADTEKWLNSTAGDKFSTNYYDEKLVDVLPDMRKTDKALIIVHLMGNHSTYQDRYPTQYSQFDGQDSKIDEYDNSILYNDEVLRRIYEKVKENPYFMAWVYFSDHGDDPDNGLGHESTRFSYRMARIPLVVGVSDRFKQERPRDYEALKANNEQYWTNDLIYELMLGLLDIEGVLLSENKYNLASKQYSLPFEKVLLMQGEKKLNSSELAK